MPATLMWVRTQLQSWVYNSLAISLYRATTNPRPTLVLRVRENKTVCYCDVCTNHVTVSMVSRSKAKYRERFLAYDLGEQAANGCHADTVLWGKGTSWGVEVSAAVTRTHVYFFVSRKSVRSTGQWMLVRASNQVMVSLSHSHLYCHLLSILSGKWQLPA